MVTIYLRITVNGLSAELSTKRKCDPLRWNQHAGRATGSKDSTKNLNAYLDMTNPGCFWNYSSAVTISLPPWSGKGTRAEPGQPHVTSHPFMFPVFQLCLDQGIDQFVVCQS